MEGWWAKEWVCVIKRCLKPNIRKIYLSCDEGRREASERVEVPSRETSRPQHKSGGKEEELLFILSILKTNYLLQSGKTRKGGVIYCFFPLYFPLFSLFFNWWKNDWTPSRPHYRRPPERRRGFRSSSNDWNMICIKANDLPHHSIKLARASGEERKRNHQNVIVRDALSRPGTARKGCPGKLAEDGNRTQVRPAERC